jgi:secondary thiamine-phosphate synthase enzyme
MSCNVLIAHITASVFINDDERGLHADGRKPMAFALGIARNPQWLEDVRSKLRQASHEPISKYRHNRTGEDNADAHLKRQIMGREVVVAITDGRLDLGPWEQIFWASRNRWHASLDGRRRKRVLVKIIGE